jgi:protein phosphatase 1L
VLKRRRPAPLLVPVHGAAVVAAASAAESDPKNEVEEQGDEFAAYCRSGRGRRRVDMEDRHVAKVALGGDPEMVSPTQLRHVMNLLARFLRRGNHCCFI